MPPLDPAKFLRWLREAPKNTTLARNCQKRDTGVGTPQISGSHLEIPQVILEQSELIQTNGRSIPLLQCLAALHRYGGDYSGSGRVKASLFQIYKYFGAERCKSPGYPVCYSKTSPPVVSPLPGPTPASTGMSSPGILHPPRLPPQSISWAQRLFAFWVFFPQNLPFSRSRVM